MKNIILEEINRTKLLMTYDTKNTLNENLKSNDVFSFNKNLINENTRAILKGLGLNVVDDAGLRALKNAGNANYLNAVKFLDDPVILANSGFARGNVDDLISAMAKGTLTPAQASGIAKGLLKKGEIQGKLRISLTNKAADMGIEKLGYATMETKKIKKSLIRKGYDPAIADEIALRVSAKTGKIPVKPKDVDDAIQNIPNVPEPLKKSAWPNWTKWALGIGLSVGVAALLYSLFSDSETPPPTPPTPTPTPPSPGNYTYCPDFPFTKFCKNEKISEIQKCIGAVPDRFYGPKTERKLIEKGYPTTITKEVFDKIMADCGRLEVELNPGLPPEYANWSSEEPESGENLNSSNDTPNDEPEG